MEKHYNFLIDQLKKSMHHVLQVCTRNHSSADHQLRVMG